MIPTQHYYCKRSRENKKKDIHKKFKAFANKQKIDLLNTFLVSRKKWP